MQQTHQLSAAPSFLALSGTLDSGLKLSAATRDGKLHTLRGGEGGGGLTSVQLEAQPVGLVGSPCLTGTGPRQQVPCARLAKHAQHP